MQDISEAAALIPQSGPIQTDWGWFQALMLLTFVFHALFMNAALGGGIIMLVRSLRGKANSHAAHDFGLKLPTLLALTVNFGVAPLLFMQVLYGHLFYVSDIMLAVFWLSLIVLIILAYYGAYIYDFKFSRLGEARLLLLGLVVLLLLSVAFIFSNNLTLMMTPERWLRYYGEPRGVLLNLAEPTLFPRWLHFMTAAVAVGGLFLAGCWKVKLSRGGHSPTSQAEAERNIDSGMRWFFWATAVQLVLGSIFLISLPRDIMLLFMGGSAHYTGVFVVALASVAFTLGMGFRRSVWGSAAAVTLTVMLMAYMRELLRMAYLKPFFHPSDMTVLNQYSPLVMFLVTLALGVPIIVWVLLQAAKAMNAPAKEDA